MLYFNYRRAILIQGAADSSREDPSRARRGPPQRLRDGCQYWHRLIILVYGIGTDVRVRTDVRAGTGAVGTDGRVSGHLPVAAISMN